MSLWAAMVKPDCGEVWQGANEETGVAKIGDIEFIKSTDTLLFLSYKEIPCKIITIGV